MTSPLIEIALAVAAFTIPFAALAPARAADNKTPEQQAAVARSAKESSTSLQQGLSRAQSAGKPISGKFDTAESGRPVLTIYTATDNGYSEVVLDPVTGAVVKTDVITDAADLNDATSQKAAMDRATQPLQAAADDAVKANSGFVAVSIRPAMKDGHPVAEVTLVRDGQTKTVEERLD